MIVGARRARVPLVAALALGLVACGSAERKPSPEALRNTFACQQAGERIVLRFERGEVRLLMPGGDTVTLYEVPSAAGTRYTNGSLDLYGKGTDLRLARDGGPPSALEGCAPYAPPPPS